MRTAGRAYFLSAAIALVAMASRAGWVNWPVVDQVAAVVLVVLAVGASLLTFLVLAALLIGVPLVIVTAVTEWLLKLFPANPMEDPPT